MRTVTCSSFVNLSWFSLILGWRDVVHWSYRLEFLHDGLCLLVAWQRVVLNNMSVILMVEGRIFIGFCVKASSPITLGCHFVIMVVHNFTRHHRQTSIDMTFVNMRLPLVASRYPGPCCWHARWCLVACWFVRPIPMSECFYYRSCFMALVFFLFVP